MHKNETEEVLHDSWSTWLVECMTRGVHDSWSVWLGSAWIVECMTREYMTLSAWLDSDYAWLGDLDSWSAWLVNFMTRSSWIVEFMTWSGWLVKFMTRKCMTRGVHDSWSAWLVECMTRGVHDSWSLWLGLCMTRGVHDSSPDAASWRIYSHDCLDDSDKFDAKWSIYQSIDVANLVRCGFFTMLVKYPQNSVFIV